MAPRVVVASGDQFRFAKGAELLRRLLLPRVDVARLRNSTVEIRFTQHRLQVAAALDIRRIVNQRADDDVGVERASGEDNESDEESGPPGFHGGCADSTGSAASLA